MSDSNQKKENNQDLSNIHLDKLLKICLIIGIVIVSSFIIYYLLNPEPGNVTFGILNKDKEAENYQEVASVNETISFYLSVGNNLDREFKFKFKIKKGDNNTVMSSSGSNGSLYLTLGNFTLPHNTNKLYGEYNISFSETGVNQIIIAELWQIKNEVEEFFNIMFLRLNITL